MRSCRAAAVFFILCAVSAGTAFTASAAGLSIQPVARPSGIPPGLLPRRGVRDPGFLRAAAGKVDITPDFSRERVYLAGYGAKGRRARSSRDALYARAVVVSDGERILAVVSVDSLGLGHGDVQALREESGFDGPKRLLFLASTHSHAAPDLLGLWGPLPGMSGADEGYRLRLRAALARLLKELSARMEPVILRSARTELDPRGLCTDLRDPRVLDPELGAVQLTARGGSTIATLVRWSCHAEALGRANMQASADYPGFLCSRVEERAGGTCLFLPGLIGGLQSPEIDRSSGPEKEYAEARRVGAAVADAVLAALARSGEKSLAGPVGMESVRVRLPVENSRYLLALPVLSRGRALFDEKGGRLSGPGIWARTLRHWLAFPLPEALRPFVESEVALARIGPVRLLGLPGELFPELALGGYKGEYSFGRPIFRQDNAAPPKLSSAPKGPYLRSCLPKYGFIVGPADDEIGYIVPEYDFKTGPGRLLPRPPGHHYEETNSLGPRSTAILLEAAKKLVGCKR
ncbi:MAG: hypothetical protein WCU88_11460 [Elusimicrobiota bacterium]|jgi:hypothetical protein